jgi:hypothetical protein
LAKTNRYYQHVKSFQADGFHKSGTLRAKPIDLWLSHKLITRAHAMSQTGVTGNVVAPPSDDLVQALKAMDTSTNDGILPRDMADQLWDEIYLASRIAGSMMTVDMPTNPFDIPLGLGQPSWRKGTQNQATTPSNLTSPKSTLTATELVTEQDWSYTLDEDAVVALMPAMRARLAQSGAEIIDDFALNADSTLAATGNINSDDAAPPADSYYLSDGQDGVRHLWLVDNTAQGINAGGNALTDANITAALAKMGKYAVDPKQVAFISGIQEYLAGFLRTGTGAPGEFVSTIDKIGTDAIIRTGVLAMYRGVPIVVSSSNYLTEADGKRSAVTPANNTLGSINLVNRMMWYIGFRRQLLIEVDRDVRTRTYIMVTSLREAIAAHGARASATHTAGIRNINVTP